MQTADSNENVDHSDGVSISAARDSDTQPVAGCSDEQNENHLSSKYQPLSWRSNGFLRNKEQLSSAADLTDGLQSVSVSAGSWRSHSSAYHKDDFFVQQQNMESVSQENFPFGQQQDKKFTTRTFEKSNIFTDVGDSGIGSMLQLEKNMLRSSNHNNRDLVGSGAGRSNQRHQQQQQVQTNNGKMSKVTPLANLMQSEDMRISKILRRLLSENSSATAVDLCKKLETAVRTPENVPYICRSFEYLTESMLTVLKQCPVQCAEQAATILGLIGYINRTDFPIYKNYITKTYQTFKGIQKYLMLALKTTFSCDSVNLNLIVYSDRVLILLKDYLENADKAENFIAVSETIAEFSKHYKRAFEKHFTDIVDIIVGWHLEVEQPQSLKLHCSTVLQQFSQYFVQELDFTFGLLGQFLEDIASFGEKAELNVGSFVGAFNSILKSLATPQEFIGFSMGQATLHQAVCIITRATKQCLSLMLCEETILNSNEFFCLIFNNNFEAVHLEEIIEVLELQTQKLRNFNEHQVASLLLLMLSIIRQLRTCMPSTLVTLIFKTSENPLARLKFARNEKNFKLFLKIYHEILMLKNVPLLQEAYRHIIGDVSMCISTLERAEFHDCALFSISQAECVLNFYLAALSPLATQTSSIIGMYALNPSILELFIVHCQAANMQLWAQHSALHSALLQLLAEHCEKNHNYRISSRLLRDSEMFSQLSLDDSSSNSPTSQNFSLILKFLADIFKQSASMEKHNLNILLNWTATLLKECMEHAQLLEDHPHFLHICKAICTSVLKAPLESAPCLQVLLKYPVINSEILVCLKEAAICMLDSTNPEISEIYTILFAKLPLSISLDFRASIDSSAITLFKARRHELAQWYTSKSCSAPLRDKYFKPYLETISMPKNKNFSPHAGVKSTEFLAEFASLNDVNDPKDRKIPLTAFAKPIFARCWVAQHRENYASYEQTVGSTTHLLSAWLQHEAARYCVRNKLRTTVGKPQETFLKIEAIIMQYARILAMKEELEGESFSFEYLLVMQRNARHLLGFLESLEKQIYNAAEGTAFALPATEKPAKTFFRVNAPTCNEWFKRIRTAVDLIAIHSMEPAMVVRYSEVILKNLSKSEKYNELLMDHTIMSLVWALLRCGESDTLQGLYSWVKEKTGKRHLWIKYVAEQAAGHKEQAAEGYFYLLNENEGRMDAYIREFLTDQLLDCLYYTNQWSKLKEVLRGSKSMKRETIPLSCVLDPSIFKTMETLYLNYAHPASQGEVKNALNALTHWQDYNDDGSDESSSTKEKNNFSYYKIVQKLENACLVSAIRDDDNAIPVLASDTVRALHSGLQDCFQQWNSTTSAHISEHLSDFIILNHVAHKLIDATTSNELTQTFDCSAVLSQSSVLLKCLRWSHLFELRSNGNQGSSRKYSMFLDVAASARREGNAKLCESELERFFALKGFIEPLATLSTKLQNQSLVMDINDPELLRGFSELAKCMYASTSNQQQLDAINLTSAYCSQIIDQISQSPHLRYPATSAKMLLTLSDWLLTRGSASMASVNSVQLQNLLSKIENISDHHLDMNIGEIIPPSDMAIGKLMRTSLLQNGKFGQAWCAFGNWCYRWGKKLVEAKNDDNSAHKAGLSQRDLDQIKESIGSEDADSILDDIVGILSRHQVNANDGEEDIEANEISSTELIESQLRTVSALSEKPTQTISLIIKIWRQAHRSIYIYYEMAAEAYFKYLCIETQNDGAKQRNTTEDSSLVTTTLRLLRLVVKHAFGLQEVLEEGLSNTPTRPWKVIIPQLFSRLNHHEPYVRKRVSELLCRVAEDKPHLIIFPAVVGAQQELKKVQQPECNNDKECEIVTVKESDEKITPLSSCFNALLFTLSKQAPETVQQVQLLVRELKRVTLLWDEYWIHSLAQLYAEYASLFNAFEAEAKKTTELHLDPLRAKHAILMRHVIADLRKIAAVTDKPPETNYERSFQERYNAFIKNTISELEQPLNVARPNESWQRIKHLYSVFQQRALRTSTSTLKMYDISPILASMRNTAISMPGVEAVDKQPIYIKAVDSTVYILPTKTKPKKLAFLGSDGRKYTYLFKGFEDLHLDERIMQFLSISNSMMARSSDSASSSNCYKAHHYSVIPLGPQSGLISWVDGVTPLFAIYKKWQQREALAKQQQRERPSANSKQGVQQCPSMPPAAVRPSELFYSKLTPLLAEQNIKVTDTRKHWPLATLRCVLEDLTNETPRDLLAKELWCHSTNAADWRSSVRNYSLSVAVMSVIGYVIGLGDRHLDNVLVNLSSGVIVHIDYNVCFEKGKTLRVPEKVPFRMTPNIEEALGLTGVEGTFRLGCEHVLRTLRKERETLLTLLEAFVYDPLVDWAVSDDGTTASTRLTTALIAAADITALKLTSASGASGDTEEVHKRYRIQDLLQRKYTDSEITRSTISMRFNELKPFWMQYNDEAKLKLQEIISQINSLEQNRLNIKHAENERDCLTKQLAMIRELETLGSAMGSHPLNTISQRYGVYKKAVEELNSIKQSIQKCSNELNASAEIYFERLLHSMPSNELLRLRMQLYEHQKNACANEFELVRELLEQSAQEQLYSKSDFARKEMENTIYQQARMAVECIESLLQYANIMRFYPRTRLTQHRVKKYAQWYRSLLDEACEGSAVIEELQHFVEIELHVDPVAKTNALQYSKEMEKLWIELNFDLHKSVNFLGEQQQQVNVPVEIAIESIESFVAIDNATNSLALQLAMLETIAKTNDSFVLFEESSLNKNDDDSFILDQQIDYIEMLLTMHEAVFSDSPALPQSFVAIQTLGASLQALQKLKAEFLISLPERITALFMLDNDSDLQACLDLLCSNTVSCDSYRKAIATICNIELSDLLAEIEDLFDECGTRLNNLSELVQDILNQTPDCRVKQFVLSIYCYDFDPLSEKYETISKVFQTARMHAASLQSNNLAQLYDARLLSAPITEYINSMQHCFITGLTSLIASSLHQALDATINMQKYGGDVATLLNAKTLCQNLFVALQQNCTLKHMQLQVHDKTKLVEHYTLVATAHFWANERYMRDSQLIYGHIVHKEKLLNCVQNTSQSLSVWKLTMAKIQTEIEENVGAIAQRLKWAVGANQNLSTIQEAFHNCVQAQNTRYRFYLQLATQLIEYSNVLLQFELLMNSNKNGSTREADRTFIAAATQWQDALSNLIHIGGMITPVEQSIVQLLDPEGKVDQCWLNNISGLLDEMTFAVHRQLADYERAAQKIQENLYDSGQQLQPLMDSQLRLDIRHLLKSVMKVDSFSNQLNLPKASNSIISARIREFQHSHRQFYGQLSDLQMKIMSRDFAEYMLRQLNEQILQIMQTLNDNYMDLNDLVQSFIQNDFSSSSPARSVRSAAESQSNLNPNVATEKKVTNQREQKRNAYAVSVWKRIRMKLEGRDPDPNRRCTVTEQVDFIIREATNRDNLAVLYEGWTPWV